MEHAEAKRETPENFKRETSGGIWRTQKVHDES
jgi:hypothetical protein